MQNAQSNRVFSNEPPILPLNVSFYSIIIVILCSLTIILNILGVLIIILGKQNLVIMKFQNIQLLIASSVYALSFLIQKIPQKSIPCTIILSLRHLGNLSINTCCLFTVLTNYQMVKKQSLQLDVMTRKSLILGSVIGNWFPSLCLAVLIFLFNLDITNKVECQLQMTIEIVLIICYGILMLLILIFSLKSITSINELQKCTQGSYGKIPSELRKKNKFYIAGIMLYYIICVVYALFNWGVFKLIDNNICIIIICLFCPILTYVFVENKAFSLDLKEVFMNYCCCCCNNTPQIEESLHDYFPEESCLTKGNQSKR